MKWPVKFHFTYVTCRKTLQSVCVQLSDIQQTLCLTLGSLEERTI